ncbi:MAG: hypothetical protein KGM17_11230 [Sphingomonadales bacterium]|nr:hypothetical protein [Sphingomonadales bacterium]
MSNPPVQFPAAFTPVGAIAFATADAGAQLVSEASPLPVSVANPGPAVQPVSAAALPLPTGAASADNQVAQTAALAAIAAQLPAGLGARAVAQSLSVTPAGDVGNLEPGGSAVAGAAMPAGGGGLTGWLSAIYRACNEAAPVSGSVTSAATVVSASNALCMGGAFQVTAAGTGCTISYEQSNDGGNWVALPVAAATGTLPVTSSTVTGIYNFASAAAFVRARVSIYGSGTVAVVLSQKHQAAPTTGVSLAAGSAAIGSVTANPGGGFTDSTTALAAGATFNGLARANSQAQYAFFSATAWADQAGTLFVDQSLDSGASWQAVASQAVTAAAAGSLAVRVTGAFATTTVYRVRYVNGAAAQGGFRLSSEYTAS